MGFPAGKGIENMESREVPSSPVRLSRDVRTFARRDHKGDAVPALGPSLKPKRGALQSYQRRPVDLGRIVLAWEMKP
jgi:hypothetical protein